MLRKFQLKVGGNEMRFVFSNASNQSFIVTLEVKCTLKSYLNMSQGKDYRSVLQDELYFKCNVIFYMHITNLSFTFNLSTNKIV